MLQKIENTMKEGYFTQASMKILHKLFKSLLFDTDFKNSAEFKEKYTMISLQRGRLFKWVTFLVCVFSLYLDLILSKDSTVDLIYRQTLIAIHIAALVLSFLYILIYVKIEKSWHHQFPWAAKTAILLDLFLTLLIGAIMSINSQRFNGNIDVYIIIVLAASLIIPMYPKWVVGIYAFVHILFVSFLSTFHNSDTFMKIFNSTTPVLLALVLFLSLYRHNIKDFINEEMLKEDKTTFIKLFEINPFPLIISGFADGRIRYANQKAMLFYEIQEEQYGALHHKDLYKNASDLDVICKILEIDGKVNDYVVEQKALSGQVKRAIVNYELIDYFGEKSILSGVADIAEIKRMENELTINASTDSLTGVLNRRVGMDLVGKKLETAKRNKAGFQLCFLDMDNLKTVNDEYGHLEGDAFIIDVCKIIRDEIKPNDIIFRYGGDEFIILFQIDDEQEADKTCRRIAEKFESLNKESYKPYSINASMGIFSYRPETDMNLEQILAIVDQNMYEDKLKKK